MTSFQNAPHDAATDNGWVDTENGEKEFAEIGTRGVSPADLQPGETLARKLSARQVQMIAIGGEYWWYV